MNGVIGLFIWVLIRIGINFEVKNDSSGCSIVLAYQK